MNAQLEKAIQLAMTELDRMTSSNVSTRQTVFPIIAPATPSPQKHSEMSAAVTPETPETPASTSDPTDTNVPVTLSPKNMKRRITRAATAQQRKLIKIAPAPLNTNQSISSLIRPG